MQIEPVDSEAGVCVFEQKLLPILSSPPEMHHKTKEAETTAVSHLCLGVMEEAASHTINPPPPPPHS